MVGNIKAGSHITVTYRKMPAVLPAMLFFLWECGYGYKRLISEDYRKSWTFTIDAVVIRNWKIYVNKNGNGFINRR